MIFSKNNRASLGHFLVAFIILVAIFVVAFAKCAYGQNKKKNNLLQSRIVRKIDTVPTPPERIFIIKIKESDLRGKVDTLTGVVGFVGKRLDVDNADALKQSFSIALNGLLRSATIDSSNIKKTK